MQPLPHLCGFSCGLISVSKQEYYVSFERGFCPPSLCNAAMWMYCLIVCVCILLCCVVCTANGIVGVLFIPDFVIVVGFGSWGKIMFEGTG